MIHKVMLIIAPIKITREHTGPVLADVTRAASMCMRMRATWRADSAIKKP